MRRATKIHPGKALHARPTPADLRRFLAKVRLDSSRLLTAGDVDGPCWIWTAARDDRGYGCFRFAGRKVWAHRFALEAFGMGGQTLEDLEAHHLCHNPRCVNPHHLRAASVSDNRRWTTRSREYAAAVETVPAYDPDAW